MMSVFKLFGRRRVGKEMRVRSRSESAHSVRPSTVRIDFLAPEPERLIASLAAFKLEGFEYLTRVLADIDDLDEQAHVAELAQELYERHVQLREAYESAAGRSFADTSIGQFEARALWGRLKPALWQEAVLAAYLVDGIAVDFSKALGRGLRLRGGLRQTFGDRPEAKHAVAVLSAESERIPWMSDRLALWGRRVVGDSLLWCRSLMVLSDPVLRALRDTSLHRDEEVQQVISQIEAVHGDLIAAHTARMESLGLTA